MASVRMVMKYVLGVPVVYGFWILLQPLGARFLSFVNTATMAGTARAGDVAQVQLGIDINILVASIIIICAAVGFIYESYQRSE